MEGIAAEVHDVQTAPVCHPLIQCLQAVVTEVHYPQIPQILKQSGSQLAQPFVVGEGQAAKAVHPSEGVLVHRGQAEQRGQGQTDQVRVLREAPGWQRGDARPAEVQGFQVD